MALPRKLTAKIYDIKAHNGEVTSLDLGETGRVLVTGGQDRNVNLWAIGQEECFMSLTGHNRPIEYVRFAYNDDFVYSADDIGIIRRWDLNAQTIYSILNGHMKSVRTLDFNPSGEYVVSGSNDKTVRLWDLQNENKCIKVFRGHNSQVNSVKFSPDGLWIASAGSEGSVLIFDIRKNKQIMNFTEEDTSAAITCIQFHPFEFLLAVGRSDGTVCIYDLESQTRISRTENSSQFNGNPINCITFSENGDCLFVGTASGISVIGWEPDREFDNIQSTWTTLGDMKVVNKKLICGCFEKDWVSVNAVSIDMVFPFFNPSNLLPSFSYNSNSRKSFSRGNQKLRLSMKSSKQFSLVEENENNKSPTFDEESSSNFTFEELMNEPISDIVSESSIDLIQSTALSQQHQQRSCSMTSNNEIFNPTYNINCNILQKQNNSSQLYNFSSLGTSHSIDVDVGPSSLGNFNGPSSLLTSEIHETSREMEKDSHVVAQEIEFNLNESNLPIITNYDNLEMVEDFPVNQNLHQNNIVTSNAAILSSAVNQVSKMPKKKKEKEDERKRVGTHFVTAKQNSSQFGSNKLGNVSSVSSMELNKLDDNMVLKKSASSHLVINKNKRPMPSQTQINKENARSKNINLQILTKPPTRARTSLDMRSSLLTKQQDKHSYTSMNYRPDLIPTSGRNINRNSMDNAYDTHVLSRSHELVFQELSNRCASLQMLRSSTRSHDLIGALRQAIKMSSRSVFVDLLGAIIEKPSSWNLDLCLFILPELYELLQSQHKFHYTRACETLRVILSNFLPVIQENLDPWAANGLGVDVTREDRQRKCIECQQWLLQIRNLPESHFGTVLSQLQNLIII